jgi:hypothetical protein
MPFRKLWNLGSISSTLPKCTVGENPKRFLEKQCGAAGKR